MAKDRQASTHKRSKYRGPEPPARTSALRRRKERSPIGEAVAARVPVADLRLPPGGELTIQSSEDRTRVIVEADTEGLKQPFRPEAEPIKLTGRRLERAKIDRRAEGLRPTSATLRFLPEFAKVARLAPPDDDKDRDLGGTIFGTDDRYLFFDRSFPWRTTGQIRTAAGRCSGTTIGPRLVLTASHCINWDGDGGAGWISFSPGYFDGDRPWGEIWATHVIYWIQAPTSVTDQETARDYAVLVMEDRIGDVIGYPGYRTYDSRWNDGSYWQYVGYPGELASGERPAFQDDGVISSAQSQSGGGVVLGHFNEFTPGQSGGAAWGWWGGEPWPRVVGVGSTIGSTAVQTPSNTTSGDNEYGGGDALSDLIGWARANFP